MEIKNNFPKLKVITSGVIPFVFLILMMLQP